VDLWLAAVESVCLSAPARARINTPLAAAKPSTVLIILGAEDVSPWK
jgi:hypothetical protein